MPDRDPVAGAPLDQAPLTLEQLCSACAVSAEWVSEHVLEGRVRPLGEQPLQWRFGSREVQRVRRIRRLELAFDADPDLAALVVDLLEELETLRSQLRRLD